MFADDDADMIMLATPVPPPPPIISLTFSSVDNLDIPVMQDALDDINKDEFVQKTFTSAKKESDKMNDTSGMPKSETENSETSLFHPNVSRIRKQNMLSHRYRSTFCQNWDSSLLFIRKCLFVKQFYKKPGFRLVHLKHCLNLLVVCLFG